MIIGKVTGSIVSPRKQDNLVGNKFMVIEPIDRANGAQMVTIDNIGAGIGEYVLVAQGSAARIGCGLVDSPIDAAIVGIIDDIGKLV